MLWSAMRGLRRFGWSMVSLRSGGGPRAPGPSAPARPPPPVSAEVRFDLHHALRREEATRAIDVRLELHPLLAHRPQRLEREDLKAAGIRQDRSRPLHELVQPTQVADHLIPGPQVQVVRVGEHHLRPRITQVGGIEPLHGRQRTHRHEGRRRDGTVRRGERSGARRTAGGVPRKRERGHA
jgi:hypothetical protein